jgi:flagellar hook assembly protein FlgD
MSGLALPNRNQPIDTHYIYQMAELLNQLANQISVATDNNSVVDTLSAGPHKSKTSALSIVGKTLKVASDSTVTASNTKTFTCLFDNGFKYAPIVTASVVNTAGTSAGENVTVILTDISKSSVTGIVRFNSSGVVSINVNLIAVGIPN